MHNLQLISLILSMHRVINALIRTIMFPIGEKNILKFKVIEYDVQNNYYIIRLDLEKNK